MWNLHLLALVHPGVKCAQYVVSHLSCNFVKHSFPAASSTLSELVSIVQFVILLISAPIVNPLAFQEIWTQPMEGIIPPTYSLRFVIYLLRPHSFWTWLREIHTDTISLGECRGTASAGTISSEILPGVQQLRNASRRALHLWTGRDAAHVAFGIGRQREASEISSYAQTLIGSGSRNSATSRDHHLFCNGCGQVCHHFIVSK